MPEFIEDEDGTWEVSGKYGRGLILIEPSQAWLGARAAEAAAAAAVVPEPDPQAVLLEALAKEWEDAARDLRAGKPGVAADAMDRAAEIARAAAQR